MSNTLFLFLLKMFLFLKKKRKKKGLTQQLYIDIRLLTFIAYQKTSERQG